MNSYVLFEVSMEILLMLIITCIQTFFYFKTIGPNQKWRGKRLVFVVLFFAVAGAVIQYVSINCTAFSWVNLFTVVMFILYPVFFMGGKYKERVFFGIVNIAIFMFAILFTSAIVLPEGLVVEGTEWRMGLVVSALVISIYILLVLVISHLNTDGKRYMPHKYWVGMSVCFFIICVALEIVASLGNWFEDAEKRHTYLTILSLGFLVIWLLLYFVFYFICRYFTKSAEANTLVIQNDMIERYLLRKQASDERIRVLSHDLKHSLTQWRTLAMEKGDANALESIAEYEAQLNASLRINVENENANVMINQKCWEANENQIEFLTDGVFYKDLVISKLDLCSLLGNLLDNAIEAAAQAETVALRRIKLTIRRKGNLLILAVENGYAIEPVLKNGQFITHKKDKKNHAIGMRSIQYVTDKYDGVVKNSYRNKWFKATVMLRGYHTNPNGIN